jgi:nitroimidazol reductase NimA-like FMN-containing flavoprotein (pyridoxamine 5'-phosphate oxidase superfamily)
MRLFDAKSGIEVIDRDASLGLLAEEQVGRVVVVSSGRPEIFPVNYALAGDNVVFRTARGTKLEAALNGSVAFEVDRMDVARRSGWSVVIHGRAEVVDHLGDPAVVAMAEALPVDPWAAGTKEFLVRIVPQVITGRRVGDAI